MWDSHFWLSAVSIPPNATLAPVIPNPPHFGGVRNLLFSSTPLAHPELAGLRQAKPRDLLFRLGQGPPPNLTNRAFGARDYNL